MEITQLSINRRMGKQNVAYTYKWIIFVIKRNEVLIHATIGMNLENIMWGEIS